MNKSILSGGLIGLSIVQMVKLGQGKSLNWEAIFIILCLLVGISLLSKD